METTAPDYTFHIPPPDMEVDHRYDLRSRNIPDRLPRPGPYNLAHRHTRHNSNGAIRSDRRVTFAPEVYRQPPPMELDYDSSSPSDSPLELDYEPYNALEYVGPPPLEHEERLAIEYIPDSPRKFSLRKPRFLFNSNR